MRRRRSVASRRIGQEPHHWNSTALRIHRVQALDTPSLRGMSCVLLCSFSFLLVDFDSTIELFRSPSRAGPSSASWRSVRGVKWAMRSATPLCHLAAGSPIAGAQRHFAVGIMNTTRIQHQRHVMRRAGTFLVALLLSLLPLAGRPAAAHAAEVTVSGTGRTATRTTGAPLIQSSSGRRSAGEAHGDELIPLPSARPNPVRKQNQERQK